MEISRTDVLIAGAGMAGATAALATLAVLLVRLGKDHPLTRRVQALHHAQPEGETDE